MGINTLYLEGRLTRDPDLRRTQSGIEVTTSSLAVLKPSGSDTDFFDLVGWRETAKYFATFRKGQRVLIEGELTTRTWTDRTGSPRRSVEIIIRSIREIASRIKDDDSAAPATPAQLAQPMQPAAPTPAALVDPDYAIPGDG